MRKATLSLRFRRLTVDGVHTTKTKTTMGDAPLETIFEIDKQTDFSPLSVSARLFIFQMFDKMHTHTHKHTSCMYIHTYMHIYTHIRVQGRWHTRCKYIPEPALITVNDLHTLLPPRSLRQEGRAGGEPGGRAGCPRRREVRSPDDRG